MSSYCFYPHRQGGNVHRSECEWLVKSIRLDGLTDYSEYWLRRTGHPSSTSTFSMLDAIREAHEDGVPASPCTSCLRDLSFYYVYDSSFVLSTYSTVHSGHCRRAKPANSIDCWGPFLTFLEANRIAELAGKDVRWCSICNPEHEAEESPEGDINSCHSP